MLPAGNVALAANQAVATRARIPYAASMINSSRLVDALTRLQDVHTNTAMADYVREAQDRLHPPRQPGTGGPADVPTLDAAAIAALIDHTQLKPAATDDQIRQLCTEAQRYEFASVCVHPYYVPLARGSVADSSVTVCTVIGFPHGANQSSTKAYETKQAIRDGATEVDMVLPIGRLKSGRADAVEADIRAVVDAAREATPSDAEAARVKVILETALLTDAEKAVACVAAKRAEADFVKTSTGFAGGGATPRDVALMRQIVGDDLGVKASGGVGSADDVQQMVAYGATRIGASGGVAIMQGVTSDSTY